MWSGSSSGTGKECRDVTKRGIAFQNAALIFGGDTLETESTRHRERRMLAMDEINGVVKSVAYTEKENVTRIISARTASREERKVYYQPYPRQELED